MRLLILAVVIVACSSALASAIREFDIKTPERLGNELTRVSQTPDRGATTPERKRAKQTAIDALRESFSTFITITLFLMAPTAADFSFTR